MQPKRVGILGVSLISLAAFAQCQSMIEPPPQNKKIEQSFTVLDAWDSKTVDDLTDAVFAYPHMRAIPDFVAKLVKPKVSSAEADYWKQKTAGVSEKDLVTVLNTAADQLHFPEFAKVTETQVRVVRFSMMTLNPHFLGAKMLQFDSTTAQLQISNLMSPLQAIFIGQTLIDQKFMAEKFQVTPTEWEAKLREPAPAPQQTKRVYSLRGTSEKGRQLQVALNDALRKMSDADGIALLRQMLEAFGSK